MVSLEFPEGLESQSVQELSPIARSIEGLFSQKVCLKVLDMNQHGKIWRCFRKLILAYTASFVEERYATRF